MEDKVKEFRVDSLKIDDLAPWAFAAAVAIGALLIVISKTFQWSVYVVVAVPIVVMVGYWIASVALPRFEVRQDQLGDNIYYLGFLLTLVSLTVTLVQYSADAKNDYIITNFGVALAATIFGILARSILAQLRKDVAGVEKELQRTLSEASFKLRGQMGAVSEDFSALTRQMSQVTQGYANDLLESHRALNDGLVAVIDEHTNTLKESSESNARKMDSSVIESIALIERSSSEGAEAIAVGMADATKSIRDISDNFSDYLSKHVASLKTAQEAEFTARETHLRELNVTLNNLSSVVSRVNANAITKEEITSVFSSFESVSTNLSTTLSGLGKALESQKAFFEAQISLIQKDVAQQQNLNQEGAEQMKNLGIKVDEISNGISTLNTQYLNLAEDVDQIGSGTSQLREALERSQNKDKSDD